MKELIVYGYRDNYLYSGTRPVGLETLSKTSKMLEEYNLIKTLDKEEPELSTRINLISKKLIYVEYTDTHTELHHITTEQFKFNYIDKTLYSIDMLVYGDTLEPRWVNSSNVVDEYIFNELNKMETVLRLNGVNGS